MIQAIIPYRRIYNIIMKAWKGHFREESGHLYYECTQMSFWKVREFRYFLSRVKQNDLAEVNQIVSLISRHILGICLGIP